MNNALVMIDEKGERIVVIPQIIFKGKRSISWKEVEKYLINLQDILNFANIVNNAPVEGLSETIGANDNFNVFRKDEVVPSYKREDILKNAPEKEAGCIIVPGVNN